MRKAARSVDYLFCGAAWPKTDVVGVLAVNALKRMLESMMLDALSSNIRHQRDPMRTTLDIADDVLFAAKDFARREKRSIGQVVSDLLRKALTQPNYPAASTALISSERLAPYGITPLPRRGGVVTNELIDRLRDEEGV